MYINHSMVDLTKKYIKEVSALFLVHLSEINNKIAKFIILHLFIISTDLLVALFH